MVGSNCLQRGLVCHTLQVDCLGSLPVAEYRPDKISYHPKYPCTRPVHACAACHCLHLTGAGGVGLGPLPGKLPGACQTHFWPSTATQAGASTLLRPQAAAGEATGTVGGAGGGPVHKPAVPLASKPDSWKATGARLVMPCAQAKELLAWSRMWTRLRARATCLVHTWVPQQASQDWAAWMLSRQAPRILGAMASSDPSWTSAG